MSTVCSILYVHSGVCSYFICPQCVVFYMSTVCSILYVHSVYVFYMSTVGCVHILYVHNGVCTYFICPQCVRILYVHSGVCTYFICPQCYRLSAFGGQLLCTLHIHLDPDCLPAGMHACVCMYVCMCVQAFPSVLCICVVHVQMTPSHTHCRSV